jgi:hypothetical protein
MSTGKIKKVLHKITSASHKTGYKPKKIKPA